MVACQLLKKERTEISKTGIEFLRRVTALTGCHNSVLI